MVNKKIIEFSIIVIIFVFVSIITLANIFDQKIDAFNINPTEKFQNPTMHLVYPNTNPLVGSLIEKGAGPIDEPIVSLDICLNYTGTLVEGKKVDVSAVGFVYREGQKILVNNTDIMYPDGGHVLMNYSAIVGFEGASVYDTSDITYLSPQGEFPLNLQEDNSSIVKTANQKGGPWPVYQFIKWNLPGDYYPFIILRFRDGSFNVIRYTDFKVPIGDLNIIQQEKNTRINTSLTFALLGLTLILCIQVLFEVLPDEINFNLLRRKNN